MSRRLARLGILLSAAWLGACGRPPDEVVLRDTIAAMQTALERRHSDDFMAAVADDFLGKDGFDRSQLRRLLQLHMLRNAEIGATLGPLGLRIEGDRAEVQFDAILTGSSGTLLPDRAGGYRVRTVWQRDGGDWRLVFAEWSGTSG